MTPKEAMEQLIAKGISKYRIAQVMGMHPIMTDRLLLSQVKTIRKEAAENLLEVFGVAISDLYINGEKRKYYQSTIRINEKNELSI